MQINSTEYFDVNGIFRVLMQGSSLFEIGMLEWTTRSYYADLRKLKLEKFFVKLWILYNWTTLIFGDPVALRF